MFLHSVHSSQTLSNPTQSQCSSDPDPSVEGSDSQLHEDVQLARGGILIAPAPGDEYQFKNNGLNNSHNITVNEFIGQAVIWSPNTIRARFLTTLTVGSVVLCVVISSLCWLSSMNKGLRADNGSRTILLGWRFSPTLICVLYAHLIGMAFNDIKRTEPFARMAEVNGAAAEASVLHCPSPW